MPVYRWVPVCQWCGKRGVTEGRAVNDGPPKHTPMVSGKCLGHPSGKKDMPHNPRWERG